LMAIEVPSDRPELLEILAPLNHEASARAVSAERKVSKVFGGSCQIPLAAYATVDGDTMHLRAMVATPDGSRVASAETTGPASQAETLGEQVSVLLRAQDADAILAVCKADA
ncbi:MAG: hydroxymethylbilane synthase, partial [Pseudomonadota bacterium]